MEPKKHKENVADLYDSWSKSWENFTGGDRIHWGFCDPNAEAPKELSDRVESHDGMSSYCLPDPLDLVCRFFRSCNYQKNMEPKKHKKNVADLYDSWSKSWENFTGGDHIHWGFCNPNTEAPKELSGHVESQIRMIEEALRFAGFSDDHPEKWPKDILDVGCGLGGSSRYLAKKYGAKCRGITLSPYQVKRATELAAAQGLADKVSFQVADATDQPFPDGQFDLVWSIECLEHVNEKRKFMSEVVRVAAPEATIIIVSFCRRALDPSEESLQTWEKQHLKKFSDSVHLAEMCPADDYVKLLESFTLQDIKSADWTRNITQFSSTIHRSFFTWKGLALLWHCGLKAIRLAQFVSLLNEGMEKDIIKYAIITCRKPK